MTRIDRRALFTSGAAAALLAASGLSAQTPRAGGALRLAVPREGGMLDVVARGAVYDSLAEIGPDGVLRPELATAWHGSPDARDWRFDLRDDVVFHDGTAMTARDVALSLTAQDVPGLIRAQASGAGQVQLRLAQGNPDLPFHLARAGVVVAPGGDVDVPLDQAVGTGAYGVTRWQDGRGFLGQKIDGHYKSGRAGWVDTVEVVVIPDARVRAEALRDGFVDVAALPQAEGLLGRGAFVFHPSEQDMALAARTSVGLPPRIGMAAPLDNGRIAERWWMA